MRMAFAIVWLIWAVSAPACTSSDIVLKGSAACSGPIVQDGWNS
jgi:hypothetical protein